MANLHVHTTSETASRAVAQREGSSHTGAGPKGKSMPAVQAPVQRVPDWMAKLLTMAAENPLAVGVAVGAATVLAYYYYKSQSTPPPKGKEIKAPDASTLQGLADALGIDAKELDSQLEAGVGKIDINDLYKAGIDINKSAPALVPSSLLKDLPDNPADKLDALFVRMNQMAYSYMGRNCSPASGFLSREGDCQTLAAMFQLAAEVAGVPGVEIKSYSDSMLVARHNIHGRATDGNVDGERCWHFFNHFWCEYKGKRFDLLFASNETPGTYHVVSQNLSYGGVTYDTFEGDLAYIDRSMVENHLDTTLSGNSEGFVLPLGEVQAYIDKHKKKS